MNKVRVSRPLRSILSPLAATFSLLLVLAGCGSVGPGDTTNAPTVTITASPTSIAAGASSTLTVAATNATSVTVTGSDGSSKTMAATGGTLPVSPKATTTYTATANGASGTTPATATATVTVGGASTAPTVTITANPISIAAGGSSTLTVTATNATTVTIAGSDGTKYNLATTGGTQSVKPAATTTYTATATGAAGTTPATATATVTVTGSAAPTVTVVANPTTIVAGTSSTLTIVATNATSVTVAGSDGTSYTLPAATGGALKVSPAATTTYTVTATGAGGSATATATVTVTAAPPPPPAPTVTLTANPTTITAGGSSTLTVTAQNATSLTIAGTDGTSFTQPALPVDGGTETITPKQTTTYTATATNATGNATATVIVTVNQPPAPTVTIAANPSSIALGGKSTLTVAATNATSVTVTGTDSSSYTLAASGGTQPVSPTSTTTYTATADGAGGTAPATATATVTIVPAGSVQSIDHVIFMMQENHTFDDYFGMLNPYRQSTGWDVGDDGVTYSVDGIDDKVNGQTYTAVRGSTVLSNKDKQGMVHTLYPFKSTCVDDMSSAWTESFGDVSLGNFLTTRPMKMNGYVSNADGFANSKCPGNDPNCPASYTDLSGDRAMGYYDQSFLNYYYYMASQFALSDRWFSPLQTKTIPNRIATYTGGTTQGLVNDPSGDDHLSPLTITSIFQNLDNAKVSWKVYYTVNNGACDPEDCNKSESGSALLPATTFSYLTYSFRYVGGKPPCTAPKVPSSVVGDTTNSFCIDPTHIAPLRDATYGYFADLKNGTLPSFGFIESGSGLNDEHPGYQQSILAGQNQVSQIMNALMNSTSWKDSVFFFAYDEGGGPFDHVPPVPGHSNDFTDASAAANYPTDVATISVQPDNFYPCVPNTPDGSATVNCDLKAGQPGSNTGDAAAPPPGAGFGSQVGFRVPNMVVSPYARRHYVSHVPMDHTAVIKFVEDRFLTNPTYLTKRDAAQPNLLDFFDFTGVPWATPPTQTATPPPTPTAIGSSCKPSAFH